MKCNYPTLISQIVRDLHVTISLNHFFSLIIGIKLKEKISVGHLTDYMCITIKSLQYNSVCAGILINGGRDV